MKEKEGIIHLILIIGAGVFVVLAGIVLFVLKSGNTSIPGSKFIQDKAKIFTEQPNPKDEMVVSDSDEVGVLKSEVESTDLNLDSLDNDLNSLDNDLNNL